jgi:UDP-N-acetylmuramyl pentapeptide phosphotransferase/UDP-N-acetylglucosamine-1-phosphate transferase
MFAPWTVALAAVLLGTLALGTVGLLDDIAHLAAAPRLGVQVLVPLVASIVVANRSGGELIAGTVVAILWCVSYVNAFNFMDGINGISASQATITAVFLALVARDVGDQSIEVASLALAGASVGFLPFNAIRPRIFLGDVGSYGIGFALSAIALLLWDAGASPVVLLGPFVLYLSDTFTVLIRRRRRGDSLFEAHREHAYQRLIQAGWSHLEVAGLCAAITLVASVIMFVVLDSSTSAQVVALVAVVLLVLTYLSLVARHVGATQWGHR